MPVFQAKARTADTYLAGIGASGALIASVFVTFMILVGAVTFDAWPRVASLIDRGGQVTIGIAPTSSPAAAPSQAPNLVKLLGSGSGRVIIWNPGSEQGSGGGAPRARGSLGAGVNPEGGSTGGQEPVQGSPPPGPGPSEPQPEPRTIVGQTVSSTGNTVEATTDSVGDALGGSDSPGLGGAVNSLGETVNGTLQNLAGGL